MNHPKKHEEAFFLRRDEECVTWIYYNPCSNSGGQYVVNTVSFQSIIEASKITTVTGFFRYLEENARQELVDVGTCDFQEVEKQFNGKADLYDLERDTARELVKIAKGSVTG